MTDDDRDLVTPVTDFRRERDAFVRSLFRKGAELTDELVAENERLRGQVRELEAEATRMRALLASDSAARDLLRKIEELEVQKETLLSDVRDAEALSTRFSSRQQEAEDELATLASLFIASDRLHRGRTVEEVTRTVKDLLGQLVGARSWACYLADETTSPPTLRAFAGEPAALPDGAFSVGSAKTPRGRAVESVYVTGALRIADEGSEQPRAVVPLRVDDRMVGVIVVDELLPHKDGVTELDRRLFDLLSVHVVAALRGASVPKTGTSSFPAFTPPFPSPSAPRV